MATKPKRAPVRRKAPIKPDNAAILDNAVEAATELAADILLVNAPMNDALVGLIREALDDRPSKRSKIVVILITAGGLADSAYRASAYIQSCYEDVSFCVPGWCKSAGTLMAIGGNDLIFSCTGEMGPLDVQVIVKDELAENRDSGLIVDAAFDALTDASYKVFEKFLLSIIQDSGGIITTRTAADLASQMMIGLMSPVFEKIDPLRMGTDQRLMNIGRDYATRLNVKAQNLKGSEALNMLLNGYPSHGFVIDSAEAKRLFTNVKSLEGYLDATVKGLGKLAETPSPKPIVLYLEGGENGQNANEGQAPGEPHADADGPGTGDAGGDAAAENV